MLLAKLGLSLIFIGIGIILFMLSYVLFTYFVERYMYNNKAPLKEMFKREF